MTSLAFQPYGFTSIKAGPSRGVLTIAIGRQPMPINIERAFELLLVFGLASAIASAAFPIRATRAAALVKRRVALFLEDLPVFASLCIARFILWRRIRRSRRT
jgi:hypothetical protein